MTDDPVLLTIYVKAATSLALAVGGVLALVYGYRVYRDKGDGGRSRLVMEIGGLRATAHAAGAVVMATAIAWGYLAASTSPNLKRDAEITEVYAFRTPNGRVDAPVVTAFRAPPGLAALAPPDADVLVSWFSQAAKEVNATGTAAKIEGQPAKFDLSSVRAVEVGDGGFGGFGGFVVYTALKSSNGSAIVEFQPQMQDGAFTLQPLSATVTSKTEP